MKILFTTFLGAFFVLILTTITAVRFADDARTTPRQGRHETSNSQPAQKRSAAPLPARSRAATHSVPNESASAAFLAEVDQAAELAAKLAEQLAGVEARESDLSTRRDVSDLILGDFRAERDRAKAVRAKIQATTQATIWFSRPSAAEKTPADEPLLFAPAARAGRETPGTARVNSSSRTPVASPDVTALIEDFRSKDPHVRREAVVKLALLGPDAKAATPQLRRMLDDPNPNVRIQASVALWEIERDAAESVEVLTTALLHKSDSGVRELAAYCLGNIGPPARSALPQLRRLLKDDVDSVRLYAAESISKISSFDAESIDAMISSLHNADEDVRVMASYALEDAVSRHVERVVSALSERLREKDKPTGDSAQQLPLGDMSRPPRKLHQSTAVAEPLPLPASIPKRSRPQPPLDVDVAHLFQTALILGGRPNFSGNPPVISLKWSSLARFQLGKVCECTLVVRNNGKSTAKSVALEVYFPATVRLTAASPEPRFRGDHLKWYLAELKPGQERHFQMRLFPEVNGDLIATANVTYQGMSSHRFEVVDFSARSPSAIHSGNKP